MKALIDWMDMSYGSNTIRAYAGAGAATRSMGVFLVDADGLFVPGPIRSTSQDKYFGSGSILAKRTQIGGKVIDVELLVRCTNDTDVYNKLMMLQDLVISDRILISTARFPTYTCIPQDGTVELEWRDPVTFNYSFIVKAQQAV